MQAAPPPAAEEPAFTSIESPSLQFLPRQQEAVIWRLDEDPIVVPDELKTMMLDSLADGLDVVSANFGFRPQSPSDWIPRNWARALAA